MHRWNKLNQKEKVEGEYEKDIARGGGVRITRARVYAGKDVLN